MQKLPSSDVSDGGGCWIDRLGSGLTGQTLRLVCAGRRLHSTLDGVPVDRTGRGGSIVNSSLLRSPGLRLNRVLGSWGLVIEHWNVQDAQTRNALRFAQRQYCI